MIYKHILSAYSEKASSITGFNMSGDESIIIAFCSASGGVGSSTMAAACAVHFASKEKKVLYLNLEKFGSADVFFTGPGQYDMSDIIFALKSKKAKIVCNDCAVNAEDLTNEYNELFERVTVSQNQLVIFYANTPLFVGTIVGVLAIIALIIFLIKSKKDKKNKAKAKV